MVLQLYLLFNPPHNVLSFFLLTLSPIILSSLHHSLFLLTLPLLLYLIPNHIPLFLLILISHYQVLSLSHLPHPILAHVPIAGSQVHTTIPTADLQVPATVNAHPMITRSKDGIYKPKALHATATATHTTATHAVAHDDHSTSAPHTIAKCT